MKTKCGPCNCSRSSLLSKTWTLQSKRSKHEDQVWTKQLLKQKSAFWNLNPTVETIKTWRPSVDLATAQEEVCFLKPEPYSRKESKHEDQVWTLQLLKKKSAFWNLNPTVEKNQNMKTKCGPCNCSSRSLLSETWTLQSKRIKTWRPSVDLATAQAEVCFLKPEPYNRKGSKHEDQVWTLQLLKQKSAFWNLNPTVEKDQNMKTMCGPCNCSNRSLLSETGPYSRNDQNMKTKCGPCNCSRSSLLSKTWTLQSKRIKTWRPSVNLTTAQAEVCFLKPEPYSRKGKESKHEDQVWTLQLFKQKSAFWNLNPTVEKNQNMKTKCEPYNCSSRSLLSETWTIQSKRKRIKTWRPSVDLATVQAEVCFLKPEPYSRKESKHEDQVWTLQLLKKKSAFWNLNPSVEKNQNVKTKCGPYNCSSRSLLSETWTIQSKRKRIKTWRPSVDLATVQAEVCFLKPEPYSRKESKHEDQVWTLQLLKKKSAFWNLNPSVEKNQNVKTKCGPCNCWSRSLLSETWTLQSIRTKIWSPTAGLATSQAVAC